MGEVALDITVLADVAEPLEVADNPRRCNALCKNASELQNGAFPVPPGPSPDLEQRRPRSKPL